MEIPLHDYNIIIISIIIIIIVIIIIILEDGQGTIKGTGTPHILSRV